MPPEEPITDTVSPIPEPAPAPTEPPPAEPFVPPTPALAPEPTPAPPPAEPAPSEPTPPPAEPAPAAPIEIGDGVFYILSETHAPATHAPAIVTFVYEDGSVDLALFLRSGVANKQQVYEGTDPDTFEVR